MLGGGSVFIVMGGLYAYGSQRHRRFPEDIQRQIRALPERRRGQHVVDLVLRDGRVVKKVWVAYGRAPAMIGGRTVTQRYRPSDVVSLARGTP